MKYSKNKKEIARRRRHLRIKKKLFGSPLPRIGVFRSLKHIYAFIIEPYTNRTLFTVSSLSKEII
jgi:large subunit ribosomal protein L18